MKSKVYFDFDTAGLISKYTALAHMGIPTSVYGSSHLTKSYDRHHYTAEAFIFRTTSQFDETSAKCGTDYITLGKHNMRRSKRDAASCMKIQDAGSRKAFKK